MMYVWNQSTISITREEIVGLIKNFAGTEFVMILILFANCLFQYVGIINSSTLDDEYFYELMLSYNRSLKSLFDERQMYLQLRELLPVAQVITQF